MDDINTVDKVVDITPTWTTLLPQMMSALGVNLFTGKTHEERKGKEAIYIELKRMAEAADKWNEYARSREAFK